MKVNETKKYTEVNSGSKNKPDFYPAKNWSIKDGDYSRDKYDYDISHEELLKKEKREKIVWNVVFFVFAFAVIFGVLYAMTAV
jgi:hypothetical protein